jgi:hypothetical protein
VITRLVFVVAFLLGAAAIVLMGANVFASHALAFAVTAVIGGVYAIGAIELVLFRRATSTLTWALAAFSQQEASALKVLDEWLIGLDPSLHHAVRQRIEGGRVALPAPVLTPYLVSLLVMLGLLGTFVGLVETLKGVVVALEGSSDMEAIRHALTAPLSGLGLAFGTSVAGVAASAMLGLMSTLSRRGRMLASLELDGKISTVLGRFSRAHKQQEMFEAVLLQSESLPAIAEKLQLVADHMERMTQQLGQQMQTSQESFHESIKSTYGELAVSVDQSLQNSVDKSERVLAESGRLVGEGIQPILREAMATISAEVNQGVHTTHQQLSRTVEVQLQALSGQFAQTSEAVALAWQDGLGAQERSSLAVVQRMQGTFEAFSDRFEGITADLLSTVTQTSADWSRRREATEQARLERWSDALQQTQQQATARFEQASSAIIGELSAVSASQQASMQALTGEVTTLTAQWSAQLQQSGEQTLAQQQQVTASWESTARSITEDACTDSTRMLAEMSQLLSASEALIQTRIDTEGAWLEGHDRRMDQFSTGLRSELAGLRDEEAQRGQAAVDRLSQLESTVTAHLTTLGQALEQPMTRLIQLASETPRAAAEVIGQLHQEIANNVEKDNHLLQQRSHLIVELDSMAKSLAQSSAGQVEAIDKLVDSSAQMLQQIGDQFAGKMAREASKVSEVADHFAAGAVEISSLGETFMAAIELYSSSNSQLFENLQQIEKALESSTTRSDEQLGYYVAQAREVIDYSVLTQREIFDQLRQLQPAGGEVRDLAKESG